MFYGVFFPMSHLSEIQWGCCDRRRAFSVIRFQLSASAPSHPFGAGVGAGTGVWEGLEGGDLAGGGADRPTKQTYHPEGHLLRYILPLNRPWARVPGGGGKARKKKKRTLLPNR